MILLPEVVSAVEEGPCLRYWQMSMVVLATLAGQVPPRPLFVGDFFPLGFCCGSQVMRFSSHPFLCCIKLSDQMLLPKPLPVCFSQGCCLVHSSRLDYLMFFPLFLHHRYKSIALTAQSIRWMQTCCFLLVNLSTRQIMTCSKMGYGGHNQQTAWAHLDPYSPKL